MDGTLPEDKTSAVAVYGISTADSGGRSAKQGNIERVGSK
jgi:hypothetical protein